MIRMLNSAQPALWLRVICYDCHPVVTVVRAIIMKAGMAISISLELPCAY